MILLLMPTPRESRESRSARAHGSGIDPSVLEEGLSAPPRESFRQATSGLRVVRVGSTRLRSTSAWPGLARGRWAQIHRVNIHSENVRFNAEKLLTFVAVRL